MLTNSARRTTGWMGVLFSVVDSWSFREQKQLSTLSQCRQRSFAGSPTHNPIQSIHQLPPLNLCQFPNKDRTMLSRSAQFFGRTNRSAKYPSGKEIPRRNLYVKCELLGKRLEFVKLFGSLDLDVELPVGVIFVWVTEVFIRIASLNCSNMAARWEFHGIS